MRLYIQATHPDIATHDVLAARHAQCAAANSTTVWNAIFHPSISLTKEEQAESYPFMLNKLLIYDG